MDPGVQLDANGLGDKPGQVGAGEVGLHVPLEAVHKLVQLADVGHQLLGHGDHEVAHRLAALDVPHGVAGAVGVLPEAADLHGLLAVQVLHPGLEEDVQVLGGVVVVHLHRDVELHAAHGVHQFHEPVQVDADVEVDGIPHQLGHHRLEVVDAIVEGGVDFREALVHQRVPGDGEHAHLLVGHVVGHQHDGVGVAADLVRAGQEEGVHLLPPGVVPGLHAGDVLLGLVGGGGHRRLGRGGDGYFIDTVSDDDHGGHRHDGGVDPPEDTVLSLESAFLFSGHGDGLLCWGMIPPCRHGRGNYT